MVNFYKNEQLLFEFRYNDIEVKKMKDKCIKYEGLLTFGDENQLSEHIAQCPDCQKEHEKMQQVSELIAEAAPFIKQERKKKAYIKMACASFAFVILVSTLGVINLNTDIHDTIMYGQTMEIEDYGLPVDSYGLIMVD